MRVALRVFLWCAGAYLVVCVLAFLLQRKMQYFPSPGPVPIPANPRYATVRDVSFRAADGTRLASFFWPGTRDPALLLLHGNAGHRGDRLDWMARFHAMGYPVLLLDGRGYGGSEGSPSEEGLVADAEAALDWLAANGHPRVVLFAESIGCGVAVLAAARRPVAGLVLHAGAISVAEVAQRAYPWLPIGLLLRDRYDLREVAPRIQAPSLSVHGDVDTIIPIDLGRRLHEALGGPKAWMEIEGAGHNDLVDVGRLAYTERVASFLASLEP